MTRSYSIPDGFLAAKLERNRKRILRGRELNRYVMYVKREGRNKVWEVVGYFDAYSSGSAIGQFAKVMTHYTDVNQVKAEKVT